MKICFFVVSTCNLKRFAKCFGVAWSTFMDYEKNKGDTVARRFGTTQWFLSTFIMGKTYVSKNLIVRTLISHSGITSLKVIRYRVNEFEIQRKRNQWNGGKKTKPKMPLKNRSDFFSYSRCVFVRKFVKTQIVEEQFKVIAWI